MINAELTSGRIEASFDTLFRQAQATAEELLKEAVRVIDLVVFKPGYAEKNPQLVAAFMQAATADFHTSASAKSYGEWCERATDALERAVAVLEQRAE